jgi:hypothetical protein
MTTMKWGDYMYNQYIFIWKKNNRIVIKLVAETPKELMSLMVKHGVIKKGGR